jgi:hypothetical protein
VLLASDDHAATCRYVGTPLASADAAALGFLSFDGSAIVEHAGRVFLLVTPESPGVLHDGTLVLPFDDLSAGTLQRSGGVPVVEKHLPAIAGLPLERRGGQADFHAGAGTAGIFQPSLQLDDYPELFQFFTTGEVPSAPAVPALSRGGIAALVLWIAIAARQRARARRPRRSARHRLRAGSDSAALTAGLRRECVPARNVGPLRRHLAHGTRPCRTRSVGVNPVEPRKPRA